MRFVLFIMVGILLSGCIGAGKVSDVGDGSGEKFPPLTGIDLMGYERQIPDSFAGRYNLVAVAFEQEQQADVDTWIAVADTLKSVHPDLRFYEVPLIYEIGVTGRFWINNGMRSGIPSDEARERTITVYTDREDFFKKTGMQAGEISVLLLDDKGAVLWRHDGPATQEAATALKEVLAKQ